MNKKTIGIVILASMFAIGGFVSLAAAQEPKPAGVEVEVANFNRFLDNHPQVATQLEKNPSLVNDSDFIERHPALEQFLDTHPAVQEDVHDAPGTIADHNGHYHWGRAAKPAGEAGRFYNGYLYDHPDVAHQIAANPSLLDSPQFIASHPGLQEYINTHPDIRSEMKRHPYAFEAGGRGKSIGN